jgi:hypothetical protein
LTAAVRKEVGRKVYMQGNVTLACICGPQHLVSLFFHPSEIDSFLAEMKSILYFALLAATLALLCQVAECHPVPEPMEYMGPKGDIK